MKRILLSALAVLLVSCEKGPKPAPTPDPFVRPSYEAGQKKGNISYQLLIYSFADSDGDKIGDLNGIISKLDYLDAMGVSAIWLSPLHEADAYHGYGVRDYTSVNAKYGTEADFKKLLDAAHAKGIKVYMDYVINHTGKGHQWFLDAQKSVEAPTFSWYQISTDPQADIAAGKFPMLNGYNKDDWYTTTVGEIGYKGRLHFRVDFSGTEKTLTVTQTTEAAQPSNSDESVNMFLWTGEPGKAIRLYPAGEDIYEITFDVDTPWGVLVRTSDTEWGTHKWGAPADKNVITFGEPLALSNSSSEDIIFGGASMKFQAAFGDWLPDLNYGAIGTAAQSEPFKAMAATADKWIRLGVDGFRLDAVKHIYSADRGTENPQFLKLWYDRCNATWHEAGHTDDFYMVGEVWMDAGSVAPYYKGLPACFEFDFWERLEWVLNNRTGRYFAKDLIGYREKYKAVRPGAIPATILTNHDETRAATKLNRDLAKMKQAAAFLLSAEGEPYIYQGEELGYWGKDDDDGGKDEMVRAPIVWDKATSAATGDLGGHFDLSMIVNENSVAVQQEDKNSLIRVYFAWTYARNTCPALATGVMSKHPTYNESNSSYNTIAAWYMTTSAGEKALVLHNVGSSSVTLDLPSDKLDDIAVSLGEVSVSGTSVTLGANSSAVFNQ